ncbi:uncharacterized protein LOC114287444 [Camellia sinensis]|uniref:uncharacterized protein LOC114287444 n=2 Tax=Camellia sinensis TaxID=4442 RepID=UPI001036A165|nr:uncharacterized protein LOC114287444 [Camellia sinensis]
MDKSWIALGKTPDGRMSQPFIDGVTSFIKFAMAVVDQEGGIDALVEDRIRGEPNDAPQNEEVQTFDKLLNDAKREVYLGCTNYTLLKFVIELLNMKVTNHWSNKSVNTLLEFLTKLLPKDNLVPKSFYEAKKILRDLGLSYELIDACINDCVLFWKENARLDKCPKCKASRYKINRGRGKKIPHKVLRYFPLTPRLKRLYMSRKTAEDMRWHKEKRIDDGVLRHPADSDEWKEFDVQHPQFALEPRNVRLGLAVDGFNPFGNMSNSYSLWPVVLIPYNLPPWLVMKDPFLMMSLLIPGESQPGIDIDVYMRPLVDELNELWENGALSYDAVTGESFQMRAALMWTIHDWPAFGDISGWRTKGHYSCYTCNDEPYFQSLKGKTAYTNHRCYLPQNHPERRKSKAYNGKHEKQKRSLKLPVEKILEQLDRVTGVTYEKHPRNKKRLRQAPNWTKVSILYELPYWKKRKLRHNIDVMHVEKNFSENTFGTMLGIDGKNKDTDKARMDLEDMGIRKELWLTRRPDGTYVKPRAIFSLTPEEREGFFEFLKSVKYPDGYAANISRSVNARNVHNRPERNQDRGERHKGLIVFTEIARPIGLITRDADMSQEYRDMAHWFLLNNSPEIEKYLEIHKNLLRTPSDQGITRIQQQEFPKWFKERINILREEKSPEAPNDLWSLANGPNLLVKEYSGCIINSVRFRTREVDNRRNSQNSGVLTEGDHEGVTHEFYGHLCNVWELEYMCHNKVVLFQCEWYNTGNTGRSRTLRTDDYCTSIDVTSRWYQHDPFILPSQAKQVFYLNDTKWGQPWQVVQRVQHRGVFDVPEVGDGESLHEPEENDVFQQENITDVVPIDIGPNVQCYRDGVEAEVVTRVRSSDETMIQKRADKQNEECDEPDVDYDMDLDVD